MGTHSYSVHVFAKKRGKTLPTERSMPFERYSKTACGDVLEITETEDWIGNPIENPETRYMEEFSCREFMLRDSGVWDEVFNGHSSLNFMVAIRSHGEMYTDTSKIFRNNKGTDIKFSQLIKETLGLTITLRAGIMKEKTLGYHTYIEISDYNRRVDGFVTIFIPSWENTGGYRLGIQISAVLALLKEPIIISKIAKGEISDKKSLCKELIRIAYARMNKKDSSYECYALLGIDGKAFSSRDELLSLIKDQLRYMFNDDGSDWISIALLSVYFFAGSELNFDASGPVDAVESGTTKTIMKNFKEYVDESSLLREIAREVENLSEKYDEDFDEDFSRGYSDEPLEQISVWATE